MFSFVSQKFEQFVMSTSVLLNNSVQILFPYEQTKKLRNSLFFLFYVFLYTFFPVTSTFRLIYYFIDSKLFMRV